MATTGQPQSAATGTDDDARLASLGYTPQLNRVLGLFANFSVAFTYLSPMVGIYSLFARGARSRSWCRAGAGGRGGRFFGGGRWGGGWGCCRAPWCAGGAGATIPS